MGITNIVSLLSGIAMFLFGMILMGDSLKNVAGSRLEIILYKLTNTPIKGVFLGTAVTAVIQSSSATSVMVVGFVNSGMMKVKQAIGIVMGAILGTSVTGWIICLSALKGGEGWVQIFSTVTLTGIIAVIGIILRMFSKKPARRHIGEILLGFAVLMFGMSIMSSAVEPLKSNPSFTKLLTQFSNPFLGILVGMVFTCVIQSASASVGILQALAVTGAISFKVAFPIIMGIGIGAAVPVILSAFGANVNGKRTAFAYLLIDVLGVAVWGPVFYILNSFIHFSFMDMSMTAVSIALLNTLFRLATVLLLAPCISLLERFVSFVIKEKDDEEEDLADIDRLDERFIEHPSIAIEQSRLALSAMARKSLKNYARSQELLLDYSENGYKKIQAKEGIIDRYEDKLGTYIVKITQLELTRQQNIEISKCLHIIGDFERIGDHAVNISEAAKEIYEKNIDFSPAAKNELKVLSAAVGDIIELAADAFTKNDISLSYRVEPLEELIDSLCDEIKMHHIGRVQKGLCTLGNGFVFNDLITNYERIADHCSNVAVAIIELDSDNFDTHKYLNSLKEVKTESFNKYFNEYKQKYVLNEFAAAPRSNTVLK